MTARDSRNASQPINEFVAPSDPEKLIEWAEKKLRKGKGRVPDAQMRLNMAFVLGHQWVVWDKSRGMFRRPSNRPNNPNPPVRITANKIAGIVERQLSKLTKTAPTPECRPSSGQDKDVDSARVGTRLLEHELDRLKWDSFLADFYFWPITLGWSYLHVYWNPAAGPVVGSDDKGDVTQGEIEVEQVPAFELAVDPNGRTMLDSMWAIRTTSWTKEALWEKWGKVPDGAESGRSLADEVYALSVGAEGVTNQYNSKADDDYVKVHQLWLRPGKSAPQGMVFTWAGHTILEGPMPYPYEHRELPFIQFDLLPGLGTREGRTWVNDLIPLQVDYNDARSREATIRRELSPKVLAPTGSINPEKLTSRVEVISYLPTGQAPTMMIPDSGWMAQYEAGMGRADREMGERAGQSDVSSGQGTSGMPAAAILALQEADDTKLAISAKKLAEGIARTGRQILLLAKQFWTEDRTIRTWSDDGELEVFHYSQSNIADGLDVHINSESAMPRSKAARAQLALDMNQRGIAPFTDPRYLIRFLDLPGADFVQDVLTIDQKQAHREDGELIQGHAVEIHDFDNHEVHVQEHNNLRKSEDYEKATPEVRAVIDAHVAAHQEVMASLAAGVTPQMPMGAGKPGASTPEYTDPRTGMPPNPLEVATGQAPSALSFGNANIRREAGIGGPGQPGAVPGVDADTQAASMGR